MRLASAPSREDEEALLSEQAHLPVTSNSHGYGRSCVHSVSFRSLVWQCLAFMRPSFLGRRPHVESEKGAAPPKKYSTEYLDGVRGVASLIVFILHWSHIPYPSVNSGWGYKDNNSILLLPFIRLIYSGAAMVSVFFVVSGFVLSHRFVQRMHRREYADLSAGLTSITFRRVIRLYLPSFASSLMAFICACVGIVNVPKKVDGRPFKHSWTAYLDFLDRESNPWEWNAEFFGFYNPQLWSIAVELRGSMVVFLMIMGLARSRTSVRLLVENCLIAHCFGHKRWDVALFISGMVLAELEVLLRRPTQSSNRKLANVLLVSTLVLGVFLSGYPRDHPTKTPGYMWSAHVWPFTAYRRRFWLAISAILIVGPMAFLPSVQSFFSTRPARYLGRISFALYLVHGLGNRTIGKALLNGCWDYIGKEGFWPYTISFIVSTTLYFPIVIWASDVFWRGIDIPSTEFAKWLENKCAARGPAR